MKILIGVALRSHRERYQKEIDIGLRATPLPGVTFALDLDDRDDVWGADIEDCDVLLLLTSRGFTGTAIGRAKNLRLVQKMGARERIDVAACKQRGITVSVLPDAGHVAVAEHTLMFMLCMARHAWSGHAAVIGDADAVHLAPIKTSQTRRYSNWLELPRDAFGLVANKTLGLIGLGDIAQEVARRACAFGTKTIYTKRNRACAAFERELGVTYVDLPTLLRSADFVSLHAAQAANSPPIIGKPELELMKPDAVLINTARGDQLDQAALIDALRRGRIGGACLDVYEIEPARAEEFRGLSNVMLTPHTAGVTPWGQRFVDAFANIDAFLHNRRVAGLL